MSWKFEKLCPESFQSSTQGCKWCFLSTYLSDANKPPKPQKSAYTQYQFLPSRSRISFSLFLAAPLWHPEVQGVSCNSGQRHATLRTEIDASLSSLVVTVGEVIRTSGHDLGGFRTCSAIVVKSIMAVVHGFSAVAVQSGLLLRA